MDDSHRAVCPVCNELFGEKPDRCFRCGTDLTEWWPLEDQLSKEEGELARLAEVTPKRTEARPTWVWTLLIVAIMCVAYAGFFVGRFAPWSTGLVPSLSSSAPATPPLPVLAPLSAPVRKDIYVLRYYVQKGDSAWRVAAALTGSGLNWQLLWPELKGKLVPVGGVLEVRIDRLETLQRE